ncbi:hypothetical protein GGX14DRAFT_581847 [Mycena pura]|uniref:Uncharacterized protein n=1 Tax=Mycena pura TaxID=153505 RepID=A0AAD6YVA2_9AGAR|nr:hypothetical protein GGX14DRAFT_581847 [Mycena pura]
MDDDGEDAILHKAKQVFLKHLELVDTSNGPTKQLVIKFILGKEIEEALNKFVDDHGCSMETKLLSLEETRKIDRRRSGRVQHTWFEVTPEAQKEYLKNMKISFKPTGTPKKAATPKKTYSASAKAPRKSKNETSARVKRETPESEESDAGISRGPPKRAQKKVESNEDGVFVPSALFDDLLARIADAQIMLPASDAAQQIECRDALREASHAIRLLRPAKRDLEVGETASASPRKRVRRD